MTALLILLIVVPAAAILAPLYLAKTRPQRFVIVSPEPDFIRSVLRGQIELASASPPAPLAGGVPSPSARPPAASARPGAVEYFDVEVGRGQDAQRIPCTMLDEVTELRGGLARPMEAFVAPGDLDLRGDARVFALVCGGALRGEGGAFAARHVAAREIALRLGRIDLGAARAAGGLFLAAEQGHAEELLAPVVALAPRWSSGFDWLLARLGDQKEAPDPPNPYLSPRALGHGRIAPGETVEGNVSHVGRLEIGAGAHLFGGLKVDGDVAVGPGATFHGPVVVTGDFVVTGSVRLHDAFIAGGVARFGGAMVAGRRDRRVSLNAGSFVFQAPAVVSGSIRSLGRGGIRFGGAR